MKTKQKGFTLIELMVVVIIICVLAPIAWINYQKYVVSTNRTAASACLLEQSQFMERFYTQHMSYKKKRNGERVSLPSTSCSNELSKYYTFDLTEVDDSFYTITATAIGIQGNRDKDCKSLSIDDTGKKSADGPGGVEKCWK